MKFFRWQLFALVAPYRGVAAFPLSYTSSTQAYVPLIVISISLFFLVALFLVVKLVYMKHRRIGTIHAPPTVRSIPGCRDKQGNWHRGLLVGCLGSPTWETTLTSKLDGAPWRRGQRQRSSFAYQLQTRSTRTPSTRSKSKNSSSGSRFTKSTEFTSYSSNADQLVLPSSSGSSRHGGSCSSKVLCSVHRNISPNCHSRYGDFGEFHGARSPGGAVQQVARRASPSSIRLVNGPSLGSHVDYAFLSALPPNAIVASPLTGTRDSFQLSRCSLKCDRRPVPVPPMPSLPLFLPFYLPSGPETLGSQACEYIPPLRFSPLASVARVFYSQQQALENTMPSNRVTDPDERSTVPCLASASSSPSVAQGIPMLHAVQKSNHNRSHSCNGLAIGGPLPRTDEVAPLPPDDKRGSEVKSMQTSVPRLSGSSRNDSVTSKKPLKSCLRQPSVTSVPLGCSRDSTFTPSMSETSTQTHGTRRSTSDLVSLRTPISEKDLGMLGPDRFRWNDEINELKVQSLHMKKDSVTLVPVWE